MIKIIKNIFAGAIIIFLLLISIKSAQTEDANQPKLDLQLNIDPNISPTQFSQVEEIISLINIQDEIDINDLPIVDNMDLYINADPSSIVYMYITVREGNSSDNTDHTWEEVNAFTDFLWVENYIDNVGKAEVLFQVGNEFGPVAGQVGYGELLTNGVIQIRGNSASNRSQKSYKIELRDRAGFWRGQSVILLNKHVSDITRFRNKLNFDLMAEIPDLLSMRTQFVRLFVKDETINNSIDEFIDYGLFTQIEQPNKKFLDNHMLDKEGHFYKAKFFEFYRYPESIRMVDDPLYSEEIFSLKLDSKGNENHSKLIQMLDDVNNYAIPIDQTFEKYFNSDNYFTWMAYNILTGQTDSQAQNYYLYSPNNSHMWYFVPWDYDENFKVPESELLKKNYVQGWEIGISNYWGVVLHRRLLSHSEFRENLTAKINELRLIITPEKVEKMINVYRETTIQYLYSMPDSMHHYGDIGDYELVYQGIPDEIDINYSMYYQSLRNPMPFFLGSPTIENNKIIFTWGEAYDFEGETISYFIEVSRDWEFSNIVAIGTTLNYFSIEFDAFDPGNYFWRITATNEEGFKTLAFDAYFDVEENLHDGIKYFYITAEGDILEE